MLRIDFDERDLGASGQHGDDPARPDKRAGRWALLWWCALPALGAAWSGWHLRRSWYYYDEWSMIDRVQSMSGGDGMMASFNGHLWMGQYWLYRVQVSVFGIDRHTFICVMFVISLVLLHVALAALLRAAGLPRPSALLLAGVLTYLGAASQNFLFAVQVSPTLSLAAAVAAAAIVVSGRRSVRWACVTSLLLLAAVGLDSGTALGGVVLGAGVVLLMWRSWRAVLVVTPSVLALAAWYLLAPLGPEFPATRWRRMTFAVELGLRAAGSIVAAGAWLGACLLAAAVVVVAVCWRRRWSTPEAGALLFAGAASAAITIAGISQSRAGLPGFNFFDGNRYLQAALVPMALAAAPSVALACRQVKPLPLRRVGALTAPLLLVVAFLLGLSPLRQYAAAFDAANVTVRHQVGVAAIVIRDGCPSGAGPDPASAPAGVVSPQITTGLLIALMQRGALHAPAGRTLAALSDDPLAVSVITTMCPRAETLAVRCGGWDLAIRTVMIIRRSLSGPRSSARCGSGSGCGRRSPCSGWCCCGPRGTRRATTEWTRRCTAASCPPTSVRAPAPRWRI